MLSFYNIGSLISYASDKKCATLQMQLNLQSKLEGLDRKLKNKNKIKIHPVKGCKELVATRLALYQLLTLMADSALFYARQGYMN